MALASVAPETEYTVVVAEDAQQQLLCISKGFEYIPETMKHVYGQSTRPPLEDLFLTELDFFRGKYPAYDIFTLGSSCVFGERFVNYLTICEFTLADEAAFERLKHALWESDQAIRKKFHAMWKWDIGAAEGLNIAFMVGFLDLAYFMQHRTAFRGAAHKNYMGSFTTPDTIISSSDYKVLHSGEIVPFDIQKLDDADRNVAMNYENIRFETRPKAG
ncbi:MAG: hypothetical protein AB7D33_03515 [Sphingobium sp.]